MPKKIKRDLSLDLLNPRNDPLEDDPEDDSLEDDQLEDDPQEDDLLDDDLLGGYFINKQWYQGSSPKYSPAAYPTEVECVEAIESVTTQILTRKDCTSTKFIVLSARSTTITSTSTTTSRFTYTRHVPDLTSQITTSTDITTFATTTITWTSVATSTCKYLFPMPYPKC